jgi:hypothetical protein
MDLHIRGNQIGAHVRYVTQHPIDLAASYLQSLTGNHSMRSYQDSAAIKLP